MTHPALIERITRSLAYMLRHQPEKFDLELDPQGFGEMEDVVRALNDRLGEPVEARDIEEAVSSGDRPRYEIRATKIRALYGHSIDVEPGPAAQPSEFLYVGIDSRDVQRAQQFGLRGGRRRFLHLALTADDAREAGRRAARDYTILRVFALDAWEEGVNFYDRKTLYLAEHIPTEYLEVLERGTDGYEPRSEGPHEGGEHDGGRGDRRRERGGRDEGRGDRGRRGERRGGRDRAHGGRPERPPHHDAPREHAPREQAPREHAPREHAPREHAPREHAPREHAPREHVSRELAPREHSPREHAPREHAPREHAPREHAPREARHGGPSRREEAPHSEPRTSRAPASARASSGPESDFGLGVFEEEARRAPPARSEARKPEPAAPPPVAPTPATDPFADFGAGL